MTTTTTNTAPRVQEDHGTDGRHPDPQQVRQEGQRLPEGGRDDRRGEEEQGLQQDHWTVELSTIGEETFLKQHFLLS